MVGGQEMKAQDYAGLMVFVAFGLWWVLFP